MLNEAKNLLKQSTCLEKSLQIRNITISLGTSLVDNTMDPETSSA